MAQRKDFFSVLPVSMALRSSTLIPVHVSVVFFFQPLPMSFIIVFSLVFVHVKWISAVRENPCDDLVLNLLLGRFLLISQQGD